MHKSISASTMLGGVLLLSACGGGGGGGGGNANPVKLETKADAVRELRLALAGGPTGGFLNLPVDAKATGPSVQTCENGGTSTYRADSKQRDFKLLDPAVPNVAVDYDSTDEVDCKSGFNGGPNRSTLVQNGYSEAGASGGGPFYQSYGSGQTPWSQEVRNYVNDASSSSNKVEFLGTVEHLRGDNGFRRSGAMGKVRVTGSNAEEGPYEIEEQFGEPGTPFRAVYNNNVLSVNGVYAYHSLKCPGGRVLVTTLQSVALNAGQIFQGQVRLVSGSNTALVTLSGGAATIQINGGTPMNLSQQEFRAALEEVDC